MIFNSLIHEKYMLNYAVTELILGLNEVKTLNDDKHILKLAPHGKKMFIKWG